jgi:hypothetical protein
MRKELQRLLLRLKQIVPPHKQQQFATNLRLQLDKLVFDDITGCVIAGALLGSLCEILPLDTLTGIDDWVEIGAALGAWAGYARSSRERAMRKELQRIIEEEMRHALA